MEANLNLSARPGQISETKSVSNDTVANGAVGRILNGVVKPLLLAVLTAVGGCKCNAEVEGGSFVASGNLAVDESLQPIVGGKSCKAPRIEIVDKKGMNVDLVCPKGNFKAEISCPDFAIKNGQMDCPKGGVKTYLSQNGKIIAVK